MTVLYRSGLAEVHVADARDVLAEMPNESVDLVIVDPPYGVEYQSTRRAERFDLLVGDTPADRHAVAEIITESTRVVGQNRHLYVFGPADVLAGQKVTAGVELIWDRGSNGVGDLNSGWAPAHEPITFAVSLWRHPADIGQRESLPARIRKGSVLRYERITGGRAGRHPTEKPVPLLAELVESSSRAGELVLDPCAGVGSTGVAAVLRGRRTLLVEAVDEYARIAVDRIRRAESLVAEAGKL